jgi:hypothetical protein
MGDNLDECSDDTYEYLFCEMGKQIYEAWRDWNGVWDAVYWESWNW